MQDGSSNSLKTVSSGGLPMRIRCWYKPYFDGEGGAIRRRGTEIVFALTTKARIWQLLMYTCYSSRRLVEKRANNVNVGNEGQEGAMADIGGRVVCGN